jgi:hypothetical protein
MQIPDEPPSSTIHHLSSILLWKIGLLPFDSAGSLPVDARAGLIERAGLKKINVYA